MKYKQKVGIYFITNGILFIHWDEQEQSTFNDLSIKKL